VNATVTNQRDKLVYPVASAVLVVWIAAAAYSFISGQYAPLTITTPALLMLAGYVFGVGIAKTSKGGENGGDESK
jgi:hypothetical protein